MRCKNRICRFCTTVVMLGMAELLALSSTCFLPTGMAVSFAAEDKKEPHLIQATSLESDYRGMAGLGLAYTVCLEEEDLRKAFENVLCSSVRIQVSGHYGSGSIYKMKENEIVLVTNRHVLQYWDEDSYVTFFNGRVSTGRVLGVSEEADVGFVSVPVDSFTYEELLLYREIRMEQETYAADVAGGFNIDVEQESGEIETAVPKAGSGLFMVDMASEWKEPVMKNGEVIEPSVFLEDFQAEMLYGKGDAVPGMSGCGVFDGRGYYLGMLSGGTMQSEIAAVPGRIIYEEYKEIIICGPVYKKPAHEDE